MIPRILEIDRGFVPATGIECSAPTIAGGVRVDELAKTGHYERAEQDIAMVAELGVTHLRYGIPFHVVSSSPGAFDWAFPDRALEACRSNGIEPIVDLMHFGVPDDVGDYQTHALPERFRDYVAAFADRYPWVRYYTPVNEPLITARFSALLGYWNERRTDHPSFVRALLNVSRCVVLGSDAIRERRPDAILIQSDSCEAYHAATSESAAEADFLNELRFVAFELAYGRRLPDVVAEYLSRNGATSRDLAWFEEHGSDVGCIAGNDYYIGSEHDVAPDGTSSARSGARIGYYRLARQYWERLGVPIMHAETNMGGPGAVDWLVEQWDAALRLWRDGVPIRGFTWYGFVNHVDWDSTLLDPAGRENACGLVSLERIPNATHAKYRELIASLAAESELATT